MENKTKTFRISYDGRLDYFATYRPVLRDWTIRKLSRALEYIDFFFVNSRWPKNGEI